MKFRTKDLQNYLRGKIDWGKVAQDLTLKSFETNLNNDILEVDILPNRYPDASSLIGLSKEISRVSGVKINFTRIKQPNKLPESSDRIFGQYSSKVFDYNSGNHYQRQFENIVKVQTPYCFYYLGKVILDIQNKPSPKWLKEFVEFYGFNSINFLVDLANFVMIEYGAPLHIFDLNKISPPIYVRLAKKGEKFISLEDKEYILLGEEIVIADKKQILGLAGIKGSKNCAVDLQTKNIFIEAAVFDPAKIYLTSKKLNLKTDASFRFERKIAPIRSLQALLRLSSLIEKNLGAKVLKGIIGEKKLKEKIINFNLERLNKFSGINFKKEKIEKILKSLEIKIIKHKSTQNKSKILYTSGKKISEIWQLIIPLDRLDLNTEENIIEEIIRIYDLNKIPSLYEIPPKEVNGDSGIEFNNYLRKILTKIGYNEVHNYSFFGDKDLVNAENIYPNNRPNKLPGSSDRIFGQNSGNTFGQDSGNNLSSHKSAVEVLNPISENYKYFQTSLIPNLLKSVHLNQFNFKEIRIFEISKIAYYADSNYLNDNRINYPNRKPNKNLKFGYDSGKVFGQYSGNNLSPHRSALCEEYHLGIAFAFKDSEEILKELKGILRVLEEELKINFNFKEINQNQAEIFINDEKLGILSLIRKKVLEDYDLDLNTGIVELNLRKLIKYQHLIKEFQPWPIFPSIVRDLSFFIDEKIKFSVIEKEIKKQKFNFLKEVKLIDIYFTDRKSITLRFIFNNSQRSLQDEEVNLEMSKMKKFLEEKYKIILR